MVFTLPNHAFSAFTGEEITVYRPTAGLRNEWGEWQQGAVTPISQLIGSVPVERERQVADDAARLVAQRRFWSSEPLYAAQDERDADVVAYGSEYWRIVAVERFPAVYEATGERIEGQPVGATMPPALPSAGTNRFERGLRRFVAIGAGLATFAAGVVTSQLVIPAGGGGAVPATTFCTLAVSEIRTVGTGARTPRESSMTADTAAVRQASEQVADIELVFYRAAAVERARQLITWLDSPESLLAQTRMGVVLSNDSFRARRADEVVSDHIEERVAVTFACQYVDYTDQEAGSIDDAQIRLQEDDSGFDETVDVTV